MSGDGAPIDVAGLAKMCRLMQARLDRLAGRLCDARDDVEHAAKAMQDLVDRLGGVAVIAPPRRATRSPQEEHVMRAEAAAGAASVELVRSADGTCAVSVGGRGSFALPPKLATLIAVLNAPGGATHEGRPGWRTTSQVATALNKQTGSALGPRAVPKLVYKLRRAFRDAGENWRLIQTNPRWGVRLAVRMAIGGDDRGSAPYRPAAGEASVGIPPRRPRGWRPV